MAAYGILKMKMKAMRRRKWQCWQWRKQHVAKLKIGVSVK